MRRSKRWPESTSRSSMSAARRCRDWPPSGFAHRGDLGIPGREAFTRSPRFAFAHNLYVCRPGTPALENHLKLRNYLRSRPDEAARYAALKFKLAERFPDDIDAYCRGKTDLIGEFLLAAGIDSDSVAKIRADNLRDE